MKDLFEPNYEHSIHLKSQANSPSTLLVPKKFLSLLESHFAGSSRRKILKSLLLKFRWLFVSGQIPFSSKVKLQFQQHGLDLVSWKLRPDNSDWLELGHWAYALGFSRCCLFSMLLDFEERGITVYRESPEARRVVATLVRGFPVKQWTLRKGRTLFTRRLHFLR